MKIVVLVLIMLVFAAYLITDLSNHANYDKADFQNRMYKINTIIRFIGLILVIVILTIGLILW